MHFYHTKAETFQYCSPRPY